MRRPTLVVVAASLVALLSWSPAFAFESTAVGVGSGALAGAVVAGPVGAVVGGITGGYIGSRYERRRAVRVHRRTVDAYRRPARTAHSRWQAPR